MPPPASTHDARPRPASPRAGAALRWTAVGVFVLSCVLNYLDRQMLGMMLVIWRHVPPFPFSDRDYGLLISAFSFAYALSAPAMGWFLDRVGLNRGIGYSVALWAAASLGSGTAHGVGQLLLWRCLLGVAEASGISAVGKMVALYLLPEERAVGAAMSQLGLSIGAGLAPEFAQYFASSYSWRWAFYAAGIASLAWIPVWLGTSRLIPAPFGQAGASSHGRARAMIRDPRLWAMVGANMLGMTVYSLWTNWVPRYLERMHHLAPADVAGYAGWVPIAGYFGAFLGGSLSWRLIRRGWTPVESRKRVCLAAASVVVLTALIPLSPGPLWATLGMSASFFWIAAWSTNLYTLPVDLYGAEGAAFGVSALVFAFGAMQTIVSRPLGAIIEKDGFVPVCLVCAFLPLAAQALLASFVKESPAAGQ